MKPANFAPMYVNMYPKLAEIARSHGYALAVHGSLASDMDMICVPWVEQPNSPAAVVEEITTEFAVTLIGEPIMELHGRQIWTLSIYGEAYIDLSFFPKEIET